MIVGDGSNAAAAPADPRGTGTTLLVHGPAGSAASGAGTVVVCRGCCCGTQEKHPTVDHAGHLARLRSAASQTGGRVRVTCCLGNCERSNTIVVLPAPAGRRAGGRATWLGAMLSDGPIESLARWVCDGGPGLVPMPAELLAFHIAPPGRRRTVQA